MPLASGSWLDLMGCFAKPGFSFPHGAGQPGLGPCNLSCLVSLPDLAYCLV